jgi:putative transport protein
MQELFIGQGIAHSILLLALTIGVGIYLGRFKVKGVSLGSTWILFIGILLSHFGLRADPEILHFVKEFGLILFVDRHIFCPPCRCNCIIFTNLVE